MGKYEPLGHFLRNQATEAVPISFAQIERVIGSKLPRSAYVHRPWWSNNASNSAMTRIWLEAGFRTEQVDMSGKRLVFKRAAAGQASSRPAEAAHQPSTQEHEKKPRRHPLFGALKGTFTIDPAWDLTQPAMPEWADFLDEKYGPEKRK